MRVCLYSVLAGVGWAPLASGDAVLQALRQREAALTALEVKFDWLYCEAPRHRDPFNAANWLLDEGSFVERFHFTLLVLRPDFQLQTSPTSPNEREVVHSWIDGRRTTRCLLNDGTWTVGIGEDRWMVHKGFAWLTPVEMQFMDVQRNLLEMYEAGGLTVEEPDPRTVVVSGHPSTEQASWRIRAVLDRDRGMLPVELVLAIVVTENGEEMEWTMKTVRSAAVGDAHAVAEAVIVLRTPQAPKKWQVHHYQATSIKRIDSLEQPDLAVSIPDKDVLLVDRIQGVSRRVNADGDVTFERRFDPEERKRGLQAAQALPAGIDKQQVIASRHRALYWIVGGAALLSIAAGTLWWRRRRQVAGWT